MDDIFNWLSGETVFFGVITIQHWMIIAVVIFNLWALFLYLEKPPKA
jgi:hypothetical protein